jgi:hypothetical protein
MVHIRSCSDSANALIELLKYVLTDGDLQPQQTNEISRSSTPIERRRSDRPVQMLNNEIINNEQLTTDDVKFIIFNKEKDDFKVLFLFVFRDQIKCYYLQMLCKKIIFNHQVKQKRILFFF